MLSYTQTLSDAGRARKKFFPYFDETVRRRVRPPRRVEKLTLSRSDRAMNGAGADLSAARQRGRDLLQERIAAIDGNRPSGTQNAESSSSVSLMGGFYSSPLPPRATPRPAERSARCLRGM